VTRIVRSCFLTVPSTKKTWGSRLTTALADVFYPPSQGGRVKRAVAEVPQGRAEMPESCLIILMPIDYTDISL